MVALVKKSVEFIFWGRWMTVEYSEFIHAVDF